MLASVVQHRQLIWGIGNLIVQDAVSSHRMPNPYVRINSATLQQALLAEHLIA
jgi:hypothetical protein